MNATYNPTLVVLSIVVAIVASYTALDTAGRVTATAGQSPDRNTTIADSDVAKAIAVVPTAMRFARCKTTPGACASSSGSS